MGIIKIKGFFGVLFFCATGMAQINTFVACGGVSPIVMIKGTMGFVIKKGLIATVASKSAHKGDSLMISFERISRGRCPVAHFDVTAKIVAIDHSLRFALLAADTNDAKPIPLALAPNDGESLYRYVETKQPRAIGRDPFHGASVIFASETAVLDSGFRSIPGGPVLNVQGEAVGIIVRSCDFRSDAENCSVPIERLRELIRFR